MNPTIHNDNEGNVGHTLVATVVSKLHLVKSYIPRDTNVSTAVSAIVVHEYNAEKRAKEDQSLSFIGSVGSIPSLSDP